MQSPCATSTATGSIEWRAVFCKQTLSLELAATWRAVLGRQPYCSAPFPGLRTILLTSVEMRQAFRCLLRQLSAQARPGCAVAARALDSSLPTASARGLEGVAAAAALRRPWCTRSFGAEGGSSGSGGASGPDQQAEAAWEAASSLSAQATEMAEGGDLDGAKRVLRGQLPELVDKYGADDPSVGLIHNQLSLWDFFDGASEPAEAPSQQAAPASRTVGHGWKLAGWRARRNAPHAMPRAGHSPHAQVAPIRVAPSPECTTPAACRTMARLWTRHAPRTKCGPSRRGRTARRRPSTASASAWPWQVRPAAPGRTQAGCLRAALPQALQG